MFIKYKYKALTHINQVQLIIDDIKALVTADTSAAEPKSDPLTTILAASTVAAADECVVYCTVDPGWTDLDAVEVPEGETPPPETTQVANVHRANITTGSGTFRKTLAIWNQVPTALAATIPLPDTNVTSKINMTAFWITTDGSSKTAPSGSGFLSPVIYQAGGTLIIAATTNYLFISSVNKSKKLFSPGLGVADFIPYSISNTTDVASTDTYYATEKYPTWVYMSMNGYTNISTPWRFNVDLKQDQSWTSANKANFLQVKSPYVTDIAKTTISMPSSTLNANLIKALLCARLEVHNYWKNDPDEDRTATAFYDIGGDVSAISPIFLTANGRALDTMDVLLPTDNELPDLDTLTGDAATLYTNYYGTFMIWGSKAGALGSPGVKYAVRMG